LVSQLQRRHLVLAIALLLVAYVTFTNAWCGDDPYITFRAIDNAVHGWGLTWNPFERVQVFTDPLWALLLTGCYFVVREGYFVAMFASIGLAIAVVLALGLATRDRPWWASVLAALLLVSSKAYVDYSTSGLENPLTHFLATLFFLRILFEKQPSVWSERRIGEQIALATLVYLNRADAVLTVLPALGWLLWTGRRLRWRLLRAALIGGSPALGWTAFSLVYYGFPFPNTAYAKLNGGRLPGWIHPNGVAYFANSLTVDRLTLPLIAATVLAGAAIAARRPPDRVVILPLAGATAYVTYAMRIGGDYMSGRLFALPFLLSVLAIVHLVRDWRVALGVGCAASILALLGPRPPALSAGAYEPIPVDPTGIRDERGDYFVRSGLLLVLRERRSDPGHVKIDLDPARRALIPQATVWGAIGYFGFSRGPQWYTIDNLGLSDALVARLPGRRINLAWGRGHLFRDMPLGYIESVEMQENRIVDPALHGYFDQLRLVTTGPIWRGDRFRAIWDLNVGKYGSLLDEYAHRWPTAQ
jgi:arabinofuranosyltransferase